MKHRLTRKLFLIVAIPLIFELALFSACALMLNLAEQERQNESAVIEVISKLAPVLVSSVRSVFQSVSAVVNDDPNCRTEVAEEKKLVAERLQSLRQVSARYNEFEGGTLAFCKSTEELFRLTDEVVQTKKEGDAGKQALLDLKEVVNKVDDSGSMILKDLALRRQELMKSDESVRQLIHKVLWLGFGASLFVAFLGMLAFHILVASPLNDLARRSSVLASGGKLAPARHADNEIGDLSTAFDAMAEELERSRRAEMAIFENSADVICTLDSDFNLVVANTALEKLFGFRRQGLIGSSFFKLVPDQDVEWVRKRLKELGVTSGSSSFESGMLTASGSIIDVILSVRWSAIDRLYFCCIHDIEYRKQTERLGRGLRTILARDLRRKLEEAHGVVSSFDEIKIGNAGKVKQLESNLGRLMPMLDNLTDTMDSKARGFALVREEVEAKSIVEACKLALADLFEQKTLEIVDSIENPNLSVLADRDQIERVLMNILSNASKVSPLSGTISISVTASASNAGANMIRFEVSDQGPGILPSQKQQLFEQFSQPIVVQSPEGRGSGLGLYSARNIIEEHGGQIGVISDGASGSTFWFSLPGAGS